jgi:hypothetical protein
MEPRNRFQGINSASLCCLACRYDIPIPTRFLAPINCLKIPALNKITEKNVSERRGDMFIGRHTLKKYSRNLEVAILLFFISMVNSYISQKKIFCLILSTLLPFFQLLQFFPWGLFSMECISISISKEDHLYFSCGRK